MGWWVKTDMAGEAQIVLISQTRQNWQYWYQRHFYVKTKKTQWQNATPSGDRTRASHEPLIPSSTLLSELSGHVLLRGSLNFFKVLSPLGGNILSLIFFHVVKPLMPILVLLPMMCVCEKAESGDS